MRLMIASGELAAWGAASANRRIAARHVILGSSRVFYPRDSVERVAHADVHPNGNLARRDRAVASNRRAAKVLHDVLRNRSVPAAPPGAVAREIAVRRFADRERFADGAARLL